MLVKVKIQTDINGKYFTLKKKKIHIQQKCLKLLPKKDAFNIYVKDDGAKYYHIGYRKVYLGNDLEVSKNICDELEQAITLKKKKIDKVIGDSITEIKSNKKRKRKTKTDKKDEIVKVAQNVIGRGDRELEKQAEKIEDFSNKKGKPQTYNATRAKLIAMNDKVQQVKNDAFNKGWTGDQKQRAVSEMKAVLTQTAEQRAELPKSNAFPALEELYGISDWKYDKKGFPVLPKQDKGLSEKDTEDLLTKKLKEREAEEAKWLEDLPEPPMYLKPAKHKMTIDINADYDEPVIAVKEEEVDPVKPKSKSPLDRIKSAMSGKPTTPKGSKVAVEEEGKATPPSSPKPLQKPQTKQAVFLNEAIRELDTRVVNIQLYLESSDDGMMDIERFVEHMKVIGEDTNVELEGNDKNIKDKINKKKRTLEKEYKKYVKGLVLHYIEKKKETPFSDEIIETLKIKKQVEGLERQQHYKQQKQKKAPVDITSYDELNKLVDASKNNTAFKKAKINGGIKTILLQMTRLKNKTNQSEFYSYVVHTLDRFTKDDGKAKLPTPIFEYLTTKKGNPMPIIEMKAVSNHMKARQIVSGLEDEGDEALYYNNPIFNHEILEGITRDIKKKFPSTDPSLLTEENMRNAYYADKLEEDIGEEGVVNVKKSAGVSQNANAFMMGFDDTEITNQPYHNQVEDLDFGHQDVNQPYANVEGKEGEESSEEEDEEDEEEDEGEMWGSD